MAHVEKRSNNSYRITVCVGYDSSGKKLRKHKTITIDPGLSTKQLEKELKKQEILFEEEVSKGTYLDASKMTVKEFIEKWFSSYAEKELEPKTVQRYKELAHLRIIPALGHIKLQKLQPTHLIDFYNDLKEPGIRLDSKYRLREECDNVLGDIKKLSLRSHIDIRTVRKIASGGNTTAKKALAICEVLSVKIETLFEPLDSDIGLSDRTILHHHRLISSILTSAVHWQILGSNPAERVKPPKVQKSKVRYYNEEQTRNLLKALNSEEIKFKVMVLLDVFSGLRLGELMGLFWENINFEDNTIEVIKANQYLAGIGNFDKKTKTESSRRVLSMSPSVMLLLKDYRKWWLEQKVKCGNEWQKELKVEQGEKYRDPERLFVTWNGMPMYTYTLTTWFPKFLDRHGLPKITPHGLRHTSATLLEASGLNIAAISKRLGHSKTSTTMDIYVHALKSADKEAANLLEKTLLDKEFIEKAK